MSQVRLILLLLFAVGSAFGLHGQAAPALTDASQANKPAEGVFADARHLSEQGKYDDAIAELQALATRNPPPTGLSHELGTVYYKKAD